MKARRYITGTFVLAYGMVSLYAQNVNTTITPGSTPVISSYTPSTDVYKSETIIPQKKPVPYSYIREADVMWAKDIWRSIDLRQRMNMPLRYPTDGSMSDGERYSLFGLLLEGIRTEEITPYVFYPYGLERSFLSHHNPGGDLQDQQKPTPFLMMTGI